MAKNPFDVKLPLIYDNPYFDNVPKRDSKRILTIGEKKIVFIRDSGKCQVCDKKIPFEQAQFGHDRAHSRGGNTTVKNGLTLHGHCNTLMRTKSLAQIRNDLGKPKKIKTKAKTTKPKNRKRRTDSKPGLDFGFGSVKPFKIKPLRLY